MVSVYNISLDVKQKAAIQSGIDLFLIALSSSHGLLCVCPWNGGQQHGSSSALLLIIVQGWQEFINIQVFRKGVQQLLLFLKKKEFSREMLIYQMMHAEVHK